MKNLKAFKLVAIIISGMLVLMSILMYVFFDKIKKIYQELSSSQKPITGNIPTSNNLMASQIITNQSPVAILPQIGRYFLGKRVINLTNESIDNVYRLTNVPKGTNYVIIHLIDCEVEYNQDGDFSNGSPMANAQITLDSGSQIEVFNMKVISAIMPDAKIYIEYYQ